MSLKRSTLPSWLQVRTTLTNPDPRDHRDRSDDESDQNRLAHHAIILLRLRRPSYPSGQRTVNRLRKPTALNCDERSVRGGGGFGRPSVASPGNNPVALVGDVHTKVGHLAVAARLDVN